jgi:hypothetical protein
MPTSHTLTQTLLAAEQRLLDPEVRRDSRLVALFLADDFREFGKSGRIYTKADILTLLATETPQPIIIEAFHATPLGPESALCTYTSRTASGSALRSSLWQWHQGRWQMLFHQGTAIP